MPVAIPERKALVLKLKDYGKVTSAIPKYQFVTDEGQQFLAVKHGAKEYLTLRDLGIKVAGYEPIRWHYDYPRLWGMHDAMEHQRRTAEFMIAHPKGWILNEQRTGKTASVVWATDYLKSEGILKGTLIISTMTTMRTVWRDHIFSIAPVRNTVILYGSRADREYYLSQDADYFVINHDGIKVIQADLLKAIKSGRINSIIVDEAAEFADHTTDRYKTLSKLAEACPFFWLMTATPMSRGVDKVWALQKLISLHNLPDIYSQWRAMVMYSAYSGMTKGGPKSKPRPFTKWAPRPNAAELVYDAIRPAIRFKKSDVLKDLPPLTEQLIEIELSDEQKKAIKDLKTQGASIINGQFVEAVNAAVLVGKILQICSGVVKDDEAQPVFVNCGPRMVELRRLIENTVNKVVIFAAYRNVVDMLVKELSQDYGVVSIDGRVTGLSRDAAQRSFSDDSSIKITGG